ncbi:MAG: hypothetical protein ABSG97_03780, partial [Sedimentisphaerales bacterium]
MKNSEFRIKNKKSKDGRCAFPFSILNSQFSICFLSCVLCLPFLAGCEGYSDKSFYPKDVSTVYGEQTSYREKTDARLSRMEKDMKDLQKMIGTPDAGLRKQVVDMSLTDQSRDDKIKAILGRLDELEAQLRTYWEETKNEMKDLRKQTTAPPEAAPTAPTKANAEGIYKQGFDAFQKGSYDNAVTLFAQYVK